MDKLTLLPLALLSAEFAAVEFVSIRCLSKKKHGLAATLALHGGLTVVGLLLLWWFGKSLPGLGNASGKYLLFGLVYLIPALVSYGGSRTSRVIVAFFSMSYAAAAFSLAARIHAFFSREGIDWYFLLIQTAVLAATLPCYLKMSARWVIEYIHQAEQRVTAILLRFVVSVFLLVALFNQVLVEASVLQELAVVVLLIYVLGLSYRLAMAYIKADGDNQELAELTSTDQLTGLGNRLALRRQADLMLHRGKPFHLLFMDLDDFKSVNDRFGHSAGDAYLKGFADVLQAHVGPRASCFRLAGDEFICLTWEEGLDEELRKMTVRFDSRSGLPEFLGLSVGMARFPEDGTTIPSLLERADRKMYAEKDRKLSQQSDETEKNG